MSGPIVIAVYKPKPDQARALLEILAEHVPLLRREELATARPVVLLRSPDGSYLEIFEWASVQSAESSHDNPRVKALWARLEGVAELGRLVDLPCAHRSFPHFEPVDGVVS
jgi:quinol monooxygenase YgiN